MKERVGFIGIGQAGGNIVDLFYDKGYKVLNINTSPEDLKLVKSQNKILVPNANGCNHDREKSKSYVKSHHEIIIKTCRNIFKDSDILYTVFSTGGGTGSGAGPLITEILTKIFPSKLIGSICILPDLKEPVRMQLNAYRCLIELSNIEDINGVFVLDNDKKDKLEINKEIVHLMDKLLNITEYSSIHGNIDKAEVREFLKIRGCVEINRILSGKKQVSIFPEKEDDGRVVYVLVSLSNKDKLEDVVDIEGYDMFLNYNDTDETIFALNGLSFYNKRLSIIKDILDLNKDRVKKSLENSLGSKLEDNLNWDIERVEKREHTNIDEKTLLEIFERY